MADPVTKAIFSHLVDLAALELNPEEAEYLRRELNGQLKAIRELEAIRVDEEVPITSHGIRYPRRIRPPMREDVILPCEEAEDILKGAPQVEDRYIVVPDIPHEQVS